MTQIQPQPQLKPVSVLPTNDPNKLKIGTIRKSKKNGKIYKVNKQHKWVLASKYEIACNKYLKSKIRYNIIAYKKMGKTKKTGNRGKTGKTNKTNHWVKNIRQAVAIAYSQTKQKFPRCKKVQPKTRKNVQSA